MPTPRTITAADVAASIDHSLLQPFLTPAAVDEGIKVAAQVKAASVCVRPCDVKRAAAALAGTGVLTCTVIGFPHGSHTTDIKVAEAVRAMDDGAVELDVVINIGQLKGGNDAYVADELAQLVAVARPRGAGVKVIFENAYLTEDEKRRVYALAVRAGVQFLKTSTGYAPSGSTPADLRLMRSVIASEGALDRVSVKAAGGVRTLDAALEALRCGATRIGATATAAIVDEFKGRTAGTGGAMTIDVEDPAPLAELVAAAGAGGAPAPVASAY